MSKLSEFEKWLGKEFDPNLIKSFTQGNLVDAAALEGWKAALNMIRTKIFEDSLHSAGDVAYFIDNELEELADE